MTEDLCSETITFGKYKNKSLKDVLKDRTYCSWLLEQEWFENSYNYLYNRVKEYDPCKYFFKKTENNENTDFLEKYKYFFNLIPLDELKISLTEREKICYTFYLEIIEELKQKIIENNKKHINKYDIKAPSRWLKKFELKYNTKREIFKEFLS